MLFFYYFYGMQNDFVIVLAWPEGLVKAAGSWYDSLFATDGKYRVGHSALILVNSSNNSLHYFDFGRYHTPVGFGRVRDVETDPDITLYTKVIISDNNIMNVDEILIELSNLKAVHGEGRLYASVLRNINFDKAYAKAKQIQDEGAIAYGPIVQTGTNCSRFVAAIMRAGEPHWYTNLRLKYPFTLSPSPKRNVSIANPNYFIADHCSCEMVNKSFIKSYFSSIEKI